MLLLFCSAENGACRNLRTPPQVQIFATANRGWIIGSPNKPCQICAAKTLRWAYLSTASTHKTGARPSLPFEASLHELDLSILIYKRCASCNRWNGTGTGEQKPPPRSCLAERNCTIGVAGPHLSTSGKTELWTVGSLSEQYSAQGATF